MLIARVVHHQVENDPDSPLVAGGHEAIEVGLGPEERVDGAMVGHVVAQIVAGRGEDGREPDRIDRQLVGPEMIEMVEDSCEVARPVAVVIGEAARVDLVGDAVAPVRLGRRVAGGPR